MTSLFGVCLITSRKRATSVCTRFNDEVMLFLGALRRVMNSALPAAALDNVWIADTRFDQKQQVCTCMFNDQQ